MEEKARAQTLRVQQADGVVVPHKLRECNSKSLPGMGDIRKGAIHQGAPLEAQDWRYHVPQKARSGELKTKPGCFDKET
jgi:hypothetical protein